jgi:hypothetical protein
VDNRSIRHALSKSEFVFIGINLQTTFGPV